MLSIYAHLSCALSDTQAVMAFLQLLLIFSHRSSRWQVANVRMLLTDQHVALSVKAFAISSPSVFNSLLLIGADLLSFTVLLSII